MKKTLFFALAVLLVACCNEETECTLTILHTNDTHSQILPDSIDHCVGGYARRMGLIKQERAIDPDLLLLDAGDFSQGTPYFNYFKGRIEIDAMNRMGYDAATLGNHEFDNGLDTLAMVIQLANFPFVCANYDFTGTPLEGLVKPYVILERKHTKIGIFGLGCYPYSVIDDENFTGITYHENSYEIAQQMADTLRSQGCEVVICLSHQGTKAHANNSNEPHDIEMVPLTRGIDVVIGGHTHEKVTDLNLQNLDGIETPLRQMRKKGAYLGKVVLSLSSKKEK